MKTSFQVFRLALLVLAFALCTQAQPVPPPTTTTITLQANPEPMVISANIPQKSIGKWDISACVDFNSPPVSLAVERIRMAFPTLPLMKAENAVLVLNYKVSRNKKQIAANLIGDALLLAMPILGFGPVKASAKVVAYVGVGHGIADILQGQLQSAVPSIAPLTADLIMQPLLIPPGGCATGGMFSALVHQPKPVTATITIQ